MSHYDPVRADLASRTTTYKCSAIFQGDDIQACQIGDQVAANLVQTNQGQTPQTLTQACFTDPTAMDYVSQATSYQKGCTLFTQTYFQPDK